MSSRIQKLEEYCNIDHSEGSKVEITDRAKKSVKILCKELDQLYKRAKENKLNRVNFQADHARNLVKESNILFREIFLEVNS